MHYVGLSCLIHDWMMGLVLMSFCRKILKGCEYVRSARAKKKEHGDNVIFLVGTPLHNNVGDQAIALAEYEFLQDRCPERIVIEIPSPYVRSHLSAWRKIISRNDLIAIHGGGFIGSLWPSEDRMFRTVLEEFGGNRIVVMPQTVYFDEEHESDIESLAVLLGRCDDVTIFVREAYSLDFLREAMPSVRAMLVPDMVLWYFTRLQRAVNPVDHSRGVAITCFRTDKEGVLSDGGRSLLVSALKNASDVETVVNTDMYCQRDVVNPRDRVRVVSDKVSEFSHASIVVTDRLHGMVLSAIAGTPCVALPSENRKVPGVYKWFESVDGIAYAENVDAAISSVESLVERSGTTAPPIEEVFCAFKPLIEYFENNAR